MNDNLNLKLYSTRTTTGFMIYILGHLIHMRLRETVLVQQPTVITWTTCNGGSNNKCFSIYFFVFFVVTSYDAIQRNKVYISEGSARLPGVPQTILVNCFCQI